MVVVVEEKQGSHSNSKTSSKTPQRQQDTTTADRTTKRASISRQRDVLGTRLSLMLVKRTAVLVLMVVLVLENPLVPPTCQGTFPMMRVRRCMVVVMHRYVISNEEWCIVV